MFLESDTIKAECCRKVASGRRVSDAIRSLVNTRSLQLGCVRVLHQSLVVAALPFGIETMVLKEK